MDSTNASESGLLRRFWFTIALVLVFRIGVHIPTPGVNTKALIALAEQSSSGLLGVLNTFSGGALSRFSVFALGIFPYISASIIIQLMTVAVPALEQMQKEGGTGRQKISRITRVLAVVLALIQGYILASGLESVPTTSAGDAVLIPGLSFKLISCFLLAVGTAVVMWLGEQITEKGIGNGSSILIFAGIVASFPSGLAKVVSGLQSGSMNVVTAVGIGLFLIVLVGFIVFCEQSYRKIQVSYAKRVSGRNVMTAQSSHLPLKLNMAGVIPAIFASTVLSLPQTVGGGKVGVIGLVIAELNPNQWLYNVLYVVLSVFFAFFYTSLTFRSEDLAENLKRQNAYIPGVRPGGETASVFDSIVERLTTCGAAYMNIVVLLPALLLGSMGESLAVSGTSLLIVVGVGLESVRQYAAQRTVSSYSKGLLDDATPSGAK
jgi:preprotein translocase subunit SecY